MATDSQDLVPCKSAALICKNEASYKFNLGCVDVCQ